MWQSAVFARSASAPDSGTLPEDPEEEEEGPIIEDCDEDEPSWWDIAQKVSQNLDAPCLPQAAFDILFC